MQQIKKTETRVSKVACSKYTNSGFLEERRKQYEEVTIDDLARFVGWLKNPDIEKKIVSLRMKLAHAAETINKHVDTVIAFYDYLMRRDGLGHSTFATMADIYSHLDYSAQIESGQVMNSMYM